MINEIWNRRHEGLSQELTIRTELINIGVGFKIDTVGSTCKSSDSSGAFSIIVVAITFPSEAMKVTNICQLIKLIQHEVPFFNNIPVDTAYFRHTSWVINGGSMTTTSKAPTRCSGILSD